MGTTATRMLAYRPDWDWKGMRGSDVCLKWNLRDLMTLEQVISLTRRWEVAVQAGGNLGLFPKRLAETFKRVYTFEPDAELFACLRHNAPEKNIKAYEAAIGASREPIALACTRRDSSERPVHEGMTHVSGPGTIPQMVLDDLKLPACDLVYLDIEGYELNALRGAEATIVEYAPVIALEVNGNIAYYDASKQLLRTWMADHGYKKVARYHGDDVFVHRKRQS